MGLEHAAAAWTPLVFIGGGFFLMAAGVPISSLAMFGLLAGAMRAHGWPWGFIALVVAFFTAAGHAGTYAFFRAAGEPFLRALLRRRPGLSRAVAHFETLCRSGAKASLGLLAARWVGAGYSQIFWILGALGGDRSAALRRLFLADVLWAAAWTWAIARAASDVPSIARYLSAAGWALLGLSLSAAAAGWAVRLVRRRRRRS